MILAAIIVICSLLASTIVHCGDEISEIVYSYVLFASMLIIIIIIIITQPLFLLSFHARGFVLEGKKIITMSFFLNSLNAPPEGRLRLVINNGKSPLQKIKNVREVYVSQYCRQLKAPAEPNFM